jgi:hypothetical protein
MAGSGTALEQALHRLEQKLHDPGFRHDPAALTEVLADDFIEIGRNGRTITKPRVIAELQREGATDRQMRGFDTREVSPDVYLVSYLSVRKDLRTGRETTTRRASIWRHIGGAWKMAYHRRDTAGTA